jgi:hypothetical protein
MICIQCDILKGESQTQDSQKNTKDNKCMVEQEGSRRRGTPSLLIGEAWPRCSAVQPDSSLYRRQRMGNTRSMMATDEQKLHSVQRQSVKQQSAEAERESWDIEAETLPVKGRRTSHQHCWQAQ